MLEKQAVANPDGIQEFALDLQIDVHHVRRESHEFLVVDDHDMLVDHPARLLQQIAGPIHRVGDRLEFRWPVDRFARQVFKADHVRGPKSVRQLPLDLVLVGTDLDKTVKVDLPPAFTRPEIVLFQNDVEPGDNAEAVETEVGQLFPDRTGEVEETRAHRQPVFREAVDGPKDRERQPFPGAEHAVDLGSERLDHVSRASVAERASARVSDSFARENDAPANARRSNRVERLRKT